MKNLMFMSSLVFTFLTVGQPIWAQDSTATSRTSVESEGPMRLSDLGTHINPQIGMSSFEYSGQGGSNSNHFSGGATAEFGEGMRRLETGLLLVPMGGKVNLGGNSSENIQSTLLAIPIMAKIRIMQMAAQSWYIKAGFLTTFETQSNHRADTNPIDVLAGAGLGGRFVFTKRADFFVEATYNRGILDAIRTTDASSVYNQGVLVMAGLSFRI